MSEKQFTKKCNHCNVEKPYSKFNSHKGKKITENTYLGSLSVDHCHATGKIRGLLCTKCNQGLGSFENNVEWLQNAIDYLRR
jgi:hypothetical protein